MQSSQFFGTRTATDSARRNDRRDAGRKMRSSIGRTLETKSGPVSRGFGLDPRSL